MSEVDQLELRKCAFSNRFRESAVKRCPEEAVRRAKELGLVDPNDLVVLLSSEPGNRVITRSITMSVAKVK